MLLRVGMDKGVCKGKVSDGAFAPLFADGGFEFIPKSEETRYLKTELPNVDLSSFATYAEVKGEATHKPLSTFLPKRLWGRHPHCDPEFKTFTYGDHTKTKRRYLPKLGNDQILIPKCSTNILNPITIRIIPPKMPIFSK
jgi:hypothetical protein